MKMAVKRCNLAPTSYEGWSYDTGLLIDTYHEMCGCLLNTESVTDLVYWAVNRAFK
jgi:hypothetical protein